MQVLFFQECSRIASTRLTTSSGLILGEISDLRQEKWGYYSLIEEFNPVLHLLLRHPKHLSSQRRTSPTSAKATNPPTKSRKREEMCVSTPAPSPSWMRSLSRPLRHLTCKGQRQEEAQSSNSEGKQIILRSRSREPRGGEAEAYGEGEQRPRFKRRRRRDPM